MNKTSKNIKLEHSELSITKNGNILIQVTENVEIDIQQIEEINQGKIVLANNKPYKILFVAPNLGNITMEAIRFSASEKVYKNAIAKAVVAQSLSSRLISSFFISVIKPPAPTKLFKTIEEAEEWLNNVNFE